MLTVREVGAVVLPIAPPILMLPLPLTGVVSPAKVMVPAAFNVAAAEVWMPAFASNSEELIEPNGPVMLSRPARLEPWMVRLPPLFTEPK